MARNSTGWCEDLKIDCPHAEKGVLEIIQGCMEVSWQNQGGWNGYARNYDPSIIGRFYILLPFASFTLSRLLLCWLVKSIGGSSHFVIFLGILEAFARHRNPLLSSSLFERQTSDPLQWKCLTKAGCVETKLLTKLPAAPTKLRNCEDREAFQFNGISIGLFGLFKSPRRMIGPCIPCHFATAFIMFHHVSSCFIWIGLFCG